ncbi:trypsin-like peptidase domain-containing protein [Alienimonas sp. DA493]|uniref:trypsin-like peptidase domain-containing protein n=1 Tax=Alienimonas sp. DA493 TaxID=3373605 RepID=UPI003753FB80
MIHTDSPLAARGSALVGLARGTVHGDAMSRTGVAARLTLLALLCGPTPGFAQAPEQAPDYAAVSRISPTVAAVRRAAPSVLNLHSVKTTYDDEPVFGSRKPRKVNGMGTAIVVDPRGYLLTNHHVVDGVESLRATDESGASYVARTLSVDPQHDLALVKIDADNLPVMPLGTSCDLMRGETVIAIGNAFGYEHTVSKGIISQLFRDVEVTETQSYRNLIQTDASINPGNSGGPLINVRGEVIGINVAIRAGAQRIGFAIPIDDAREVLAELMSVERLENRTHGAQFADRKTPSSKQAVVARVDPRSPAGRGGLNRGDVVERVGRTPVEDAADFERALLGVRPGETVTLTVLRDGNRVPVSLSLPGAGRAVAQVPSQTRQIAARTAAARTVEPPPKKATADDAVQRFEARSGCKIERVVATPGERLAEFGYKGGYRVAEVRSGGPADRALIKAGDILLGLHDFSTLIPADFAYILNLAADDDVKMLRCDILRGSDRLYTFLKLDEE